MVNVKRGPAPCLVLFVLGMLVQAALVEAVATPVCPDACMDTSLQPLANSVRESEMSLTTLTSQVTSLRGAVDEQVAADTRTVDDLQRRIIALSAQAAEIEDAVSMVTTWVEGSAGELQQADHVAALLNDTQRIDGLLSDLQAALSTYQTARDALAVTFDAHRELQERINQDFMETLNGYDPRLTDIIQRRDPVELVPEDCDDYYNTYQPSGRVPVFLAGNRSRLVRVHCDQDTAGGGWLLIQRRTDASVNFSRDWSDYKDGFGDDNNFWIGNEALHALTAHKSYRLRVEMTSSRGAARWAEYARFSVAGEDDRYRLTVGSYSGTAGDSLTQAHNGLGFTTYDRDSDRSGGNCARNYRGGWWYNMCHHANPNGEYYSAGEHVPFGRGIHWMTITWFSRSLRSVEMKIRPVDHHDHPYRG